MLAALEPLYRRMDAAVLADIYSHDIYDLEHNTRAPITLFDTGHPHGRYLGHIYLMGAGPRDISANFIGIRESINNMLAKAHRKEFAVTGVANRLLYGAYLYVMEYDAPRKYLQLEAPIGPMPKIAERLGFKYGETFDLSQPFPVTYPLTLTII